MKYAIVHTATTTGIKQELEAGIRAKVDPNASFAHYENPDLLKVAVSAGYLTPEVVGG